MAKLNESQKTKLLSLVLAMETTNSMTEGCFKATYGCTKKQTRLHHAKMLRDFIDNN